MSITVRDCLNLPSLSFAKVVAGSEGLDKIVTSVSVSEFFESSEGHYDIEVFTPNELLISAFYSVRDDIGKQCAAIQEMNRTGAVAIVLFYVGEILENIDEQVIDTANNLKLPIIVINSTNRKIKYSDIISDVTKKLNDDRKKASGIVDEIRIRAQQMPPELSTMENLLQMLADYYKCSIFLIGSNKIYFEAFYNASYTIKAPDILYKTLSNNSADFQEGTIICNNIKYNIYRIDFSFTLNTPMSLYVSCSKLKLSKDDLQNMCICTRFFTTVWNYNLDLTMPDTVLYLILKSDVNAANKYIKYSNIHFHNLSHLLILESGERTSQEVKSAIEKSLTSNGDYFLKCTIDGSCIVLTNTKQVNLESIFLDVKKRLGQDVSLSMFFADIKQGALEIKTLYLHYRKTINTMRKIYLEKRVWSIYELNLAQEIVDISNGNSYKLKYLEDIIQSIEDEENDFMETLATYMIDCDSQLHSTANKLYIHRNTVTYRLKRIKTITGVDFSKMPAHFDFYLAASLWRLRQ